MDMHYNDDVREGRVLTSAFKKKKISQKSNYPIGSFEKHTLGVGRKLVRIKARRIVVFFVTKRSETKRFFATIR